MVSRSLSFTLPRYGALVLAIAIAAAVGGCAQSPSASLDNPAASSGSSIPDTNYHTFPYDLQTGP